MEMSTYANAGSVSKPWGFGKNHKIVSNANNKFGIPPWTKKDIFFGLPPPQVLKKKTGKTVLPTGSLERR